MRPAIRRQSPPNLAAGFRDGRPAPATPLGPDVARIFQSRDARDISAAAKELLRTHGSCITAMDLGDLMVSFGKKKGAKRLTLDDELISLLPLGRVTPRVDQAMQILRAAHTPPTEASRRLIGCFADQLCAAESLSMVQISSCFNALVKCEADAVAAILRALAAHLGRCKAEFGGQAIGNILYGLQSMKSDDAAVCTVLSVLANKMRQSKDNLSAQNIGNALYGLRRMSSDVPEVRAVLSEMAPKIGHSKEVLSAS